MQGCPLERRRATATVGLNRRGGIHMGQYRFLLAVLVVLSHCGLKISGINPGIVAVISFYILSGFVMTELVRRHYPTPCRTLAFYVDRTARLFPQFWFYCAITTALWATGWVKTDWLADVTVRGLLLNYLMMPLDLYMPDFLALNGTMLMPQAWSLGLELMFYAIVPLLLHRCGFAARCAIAALSFAIFAAAILGLIHTNNFAYKLLPGTLFIFIAGIALADRTRGATALVCIIFAGCLGLLLAGKAPWNDHAGLMLGRAVLLGILIGTIAVALLRDTDSTAFDELAGNLSYGVFLNHYIFIWLIETQWGIETFNPQIMAGVVACSILLSVASYRFVEKPVIMWRRRIRYGSAGQHDANNVRWAPSRWFSGFSWRFRRPVAA
jgi:peptidoglycan/LPS O-acetylase OafA/YrhL